MGSEAVCPTSAGLASDESLVRSARAGDRAAFEALVNRHQRAALATCLAVLRDRQLAEDAVQDAFVAGYRHLGGLRDPAGFGGWLLSIARNRATRLARQRSRRLRLVREGEPDEHAGRGRAAPSRVGDEPLDEALLAALAALPDHERSVVVLRYFDGHGVADVAAITGRPVGTVTKQLQRAHERLRKALKDER